MPSDISDFFSIEQQGQIHDAIYHAELMTSGEIRVHLENRCRGESPEARAAEVFEKLRMHQTEQRNGVLFYLAVMDKKFAVIGDAGIHAVVGDEFWESLRDAMVDDFKEGRFTEGLVNGIETCGEILKKAFPHQDDDINELSDEISFGSEL